MLLSGKLNPATVSLPLLGVEPPVVGELPQAAAIVATTASAAMSHTDTGLRFIRVPPFGAWAPGGLPQPTPIRTAVEYRLFHLPIDCYATLKTVARGATGALGSRRPGGTSARCTADGPSSVARARAATSSAPATISGYTCVAYPSTMYRPSPPPAT